MVGRPEGRGLAGEAQATPNGRNGAKTILGPPLILEGGPPKLLNPAYGPDRSSWALINSQLQEKKVWRQKTADHFPSKQI